MLSCEMMLLTEFDNFVTIVLFLSGVWYFYMFDFLSTSVLPMLFHKGESELECERG